MVVVSITPIGSWYRLRMTFIPRFVKCSSFTFRKLGSSGHQKLKVRASSLLARFLWGLTTPWNWIGMDKRQIIWTCRTNKIDAIVEQWTKIINAEMMEKRAAARDSSLTWVPLFVIESLRYTAPANCKPHFVGVHTFRQCLRLETSYWSMGWNPRPRLSFFAQLPRNLYRGCMLLFRMSEVRNEFPRGHALTTRKSRTPSPLHFYHCKCKRCFVTRLSR